MEHNLFKEYRKSHMFLNEVYFWTDTIHAWRHLLRNDSFKHVIISQLKWLVDNRKIKVYGFSRYNRDTKSYSSYLGIA